MRNPKRINDTTEKIKKLWELLPDLRFWQLVNIIFETLPSDKVGQDPFFFEESVWNEALDSAIQKYSRKEK